MNSIVLVVSLIFLVACDGFARIRNGYERQIQAAKSALHTIKLRLTNANNLSAQERNALETEVQRLASLVSCFELTEELIARLERISPAIYWDVENVTDKKGRPTDVYIKLVPDTRSRLNLKAASFVKQAIDDADACCSEHGPYSVAIDVCIRDNSLFLLCHELGHIKYIIPNLAAYKQFYRRVYGQPKYSNLPYIGHNRQDKSGLSARKFEHSHRKDMVDYKKSVGGELRSFVSLYSRLQRIHGNVKANHENIIANVF